MEDNGSKPARSAMKKYLKKESFREGVKIFTGAAVGFSFFWLTSNPRSAVHKRLPLKKVRNFHYLPHIKIVRRDTTYRLHHWSTMTGIYFISLLTRKGLVRSKVFHGFMVGSIVQGLLFTDRFSFVE